MQSINKNIYGLFDVLLSVSKYQKKYDYDISVKELLTMLTRGNSTAFQYLLDTGFISSNRPREHEIADICQSLNLYFNKADGVVGKNNFRNSKNEINAAIKENADFFNSISKQYNSSYAITF